MSGEPYVITLVAKDAADGDVVNRHEPHPELRYLYGDSMLYIHPDECTSCDACMPECPVDAIYPADQVPADQLEFIATNRFVFAETSA